MFVLYLRSGSGMDGDSRAAACLLYVSKYCSHISNNYGYIERTLKSVHLVAVRAPREVWGSGYGNMIVSL